MPDNFCIAPFIHLNNTPRGKINPCCVWNGPAMGNMERGILDAWTDDKMVTLRNQFLNNVRPKECSECWDVEDAGSKQSFRIRANKDFKKYLHLKKRLDKPIWLQLKLGAKCNLTCRTCSSGSSNQWLKADAIVAYENLTDIKLQKKLQKEYVKNRQQDSSFIYEEQFWQELKHVTPSLEYITFTGGEPLLIDEHYEYLEWCVENDYAKNISLDYITNGTIGLDDYKKDLWSNFKGVELIISMDGIGKLAEYIRTGVKWNEVKENIIGYQKYHKEHKKFTFSGITFLVSTYNIFFINDSIKFYKDNNIHLNINYLHYPYWQSIKNLPNKVKKQLSARGLPEEINNFMHQASNEDFTFCDRIEKQEKIYKQTTRKTLRYAKLFPDWWEMLNENRTMR